MMSSRGESGTERSRGGFRPSGRQVGTGIVAIVLVVFIAVNRTKVSIDFLFFDVTMSLWLVLAGTALVGVVVGMGLSSRRAKRKRRGG